MDEHRPLRTFGRIKARTLKPRQAGLMETLLPHLAVPEEGEINVEALFLPSPRGEGVGGGANLIASSLTPPPGPLLSRGGGSLQRVFEHAEAFGER